MAGSLYEITEIGNGCCANRDEILKLPNGNLPLKTWETIPFMLFILVLET